MNIEQQRIEAITCLIDGTEDATLYWRLSNRHEFKCETSNEFNLLQHTITSRYKELLIEGNSDRSLISAVTTGNIDVLSLVSDLNLAIRKAIERRELLSASNAMSSLVANLTNKT